MLGQENTPPAFTSYIPESKEALGYCCNQGAWPQTACRRTEAGNPLMPQVLKRPQAETDPDEILWYTAQDNPDNVDRFLDKIEERGRVLLPAFFECALESCFTVPPDLP